MKATGGDSPEERTPGKAEGSEEGPELLTPGWRPTGQKESSEHRAGGADPFRGPARA